MGKLDKIEAEIAESISVKQVLLTDKPVLNAIHQLSEDCLISLKSGCKIIFCGNGGSFADAQHLSAELVSRFKFDRHPLASLVLGANASSISAIGNDYGYDSVFARELECIGQVGDVFIPITTSGESKNVIEAIKTANVLGLKTVCFTGSRDSTVASLCSCIAVPSPQTARIQECHILLGHILCGLIEDRLFGNNE